MSYQNATLPEWWNLPWAEPVQFETVNNLTGCQLDDGRGLLMWTNGGNVRMGFVSNPILWLVDGSCTSATTVTGLPAATKLAVSCFRVGSGLYLCVNAANGTGVGRTDIYVADSASNPTSWSLHGAMATSATITNSSFYDASQRVCGIPYVDGSTWLLPITYSVNVSGSHGQRHAVYRSTNSGALWSTFAITGQTGALNQNTGQSSSHVGRDPSTGNLFTFGYIGSGGGTEQWYRSTDTGANWTAIQSGSVTAGTTTHPRAFMDDGTDMYGVFNDGIKRFNDPDNDYRDTTTVVTFSSSIGMGNGTGPNIPTGRVHVCADNAGHLFLFNNTRVLWTQLGGALTVGYLRLGP